METTGEPAPDPGPTPTEVQVREAGIGLGIGVLGFVGTQGAGLVLALLALPFYGGEIVTEVEAIATLGTGVGAVVVAALYFAVSRHDASFLDLSVPDLRDLAYSVAGLLLLFGALVGATVVMNQFGVESSSHSIEESAQNGNAAILLYMIPVAILVIGPGEELIYRNLVQKRLSEVLSRWGAILVASVIFASVHLSAYLTAPLGEVVMSLGVVFVLSVVLGWVYDRTRNLVVPALVHGVFNASQFGLMYYNITGEIPFA